MCDRQSVLAHLIDLKMGKVSYQKFVNPQRSMTVEITHDGFYFNVSINGQKPLKMRHIEAIVSSMERDQVVYLDDFRK